VSETRRTALWRGSTRYPLRARNIVQGSFFRDGFEYKEAENANMVSFEVKAQGLAMRHAKTYAQLNAFDWSN